MKYLISTLIFGFLLAVTPALAQSPIGKWKTIDDETGRVKSIVQIYEQEGKLFGKIVELFRLPDEDPDPNCTKCSKKDPRYNKRVKGMVIMEDLEKESDTEWEGGKILDPANGKVYGCQITMESADKLKVRGYLGFSLLGRNQYWERVE